MTLNTPTISDDLTSDIKEINLSYLVLAQRLLRDNFADGLYRLGFSKDSAEVLLGLSLSQLVTLASSPSLICGFRLDDASLLSALSQSNLRGALQQARATLALAQGKTAVKPTAVLEMQCNG